MKGIDNKLASLVTRGGDLMESLASEYLSVSGKVSVYHNGISVDPSSGTCLANFLVVKGGKEVVAVFGFGSRGSEVTLTRRPPCSQGIMRDPDDPLEFLSETVPLAEKGRIASLLGRYLSV